VVRQGFENKNVSQDTRNDKFTKNKRKTDGERKIAGELGISLGAVNKYLRA
jgi:transposase